MYYQSLFIYLFIYFMIVFLIFLVVGAMSQWLFTDLINVDVDLDVGESKIMSFWCQAKC